MVTASLFSWKLIPPFPTWSCSSHTQTNLLLFPLSGGICFGVLTAKTRRWFGFSALQTQRVWIPPVSRPLAPLLKCGEGKEAFKITAFMLKAPKWCNGWLCALVWSSEQGINKGWGVHVRSGSSLAVAAAASLASFIWDESLSIFGCFNPTVAPLLPCLSCFKSTRLFSTCHLQSFSGFFNPLSFSIKPLPPPLPPPLQVWHYQMSQGKKKVWEN